MTRLTVDGVEGVLADALKRVASDSERIVLHHDGKDVAVLIPVEDLAWLEETEDRIDLEEALKVLNDPSDEIMDWEKAKKEGYAC